MVQEIVRKFNGDEKNVVLTGFSRGAIACGFIGLRNDAIASLGKGQHVCQHFDGDGWGGADMFGARERLKRLGSIAIFHTDNTDEDLTTMLSNVSGEVVYESSGLWLMPVICFWTIDLQH